LSKESNIDPREVPVSRRSPRILPYVMLLFLPTACVSAQTPAGSTFAQADRFSAGN
jgi:hypothetical protein